MPWLTGHVLRYQCITKMAEGNIDRATAKRVAGHITDKMWDKYSQVRLESIREKMAEAFDCSGHGREVVSPASLPQTDGPAPPPPILSPIDPISPVIQAEVARQVALALRKQQQEAPAGGARVIRFPGAG
jgi:hypothetical protein